MHRCQGPQPIVISGRQRFFLQSESLKLDRLVWWTDIRQSDISDQILDNLLLGRPHKTLVFDRIQGDIGVLDFDLKDQLQPCDRRSSRAPITKAELSDFSANARGCQSGLFFQLSYGRV